jgi:hypothetical protein
MPISESKPKISNFISVNAENLEQMSQRLRSPSPPATPNSTKKSLVMPNLAA